MGILADRTDFLVCKGITALAVLYIGLGIDNGAGQLLYLVLRHV